MPVVVGHRADQLAPSGWRRTGRGPMLPWTARSVARSSSAIWDGPSSPIETPACEPRQAGSAPADRRHADEVVGAGEERRERRRERRPAAHLHADGGGDHLLLGDVASRRSGRGCAFANSSAWVELPTSPSSATTSPRRRAERRERLAERLAGRDLSRRARSAAAQRAGRRRSACGCSGRVGLRRPSTWMSRDAAELLDRRFGVLRAACRACPPCWPPLRRPWPLIVRATITVGRAGGRARPR